MYKYSLLLIICAFHLRLAIANTYTVTTFHDLELALLTSASEQSTTIYVSPGSYEFNSSINITLPNSNKQLFITRTLNQTNEVVFDGDGSRRLFDIISNNSGTTNEVKFSNITFYNGHASGTTSGGGGVRVQAINGSTSLSFEYCIFQSCSANFGGAIEFSGINESNLTVDHCQFLECVSECADFGEEEASPGGGILYRNNDGTCSVSNTLFQYCGGYIGGDLYIKSDIFVSDSNIHENSQGFKYPVLYCDSREVSVERISLSGYFFNNEYNCDALQYTWSTICIKNSNVVLIDDCDFSDCSYINYGVFGFDIQNCDDVTINDFYAADCYNSGLDGAAMIQIYHCSDVLINNFGFDSTDFYDCNLQSGDDVSLISAIGDESCDNLTITNGKISNVEFGSYNSTLNTSLINIQNYHSNLSDIIFNGNLIQGDLNAYIISHIGSESIGLNDIEMTNNTINHFDVNQVALIKKYGDKIDIVNCLIANNTINYSELTSNYIDIISIINSSICANSIKNLTIVNNVSNNGYNEIIRASSDFATTYLKQCAIINNRAEKILDDCDGIEIDYCSITENNATGLDEWIGDDCLSEYRSGNQLTHNNHAISPIFVNENEIDYRQRWNSELLDKGDRIGEDPDYDLSSPDIGWSKRYQETEISGNVNISQPGNYKIVGNTIINGPDVDTVIPAGCSIKSDSDYACYIRDNSAVNNYNISIGDPNGARTSFVGPYITFGSPLPSQEDMTNIQFNGTLFNQGAPVDGSQLTFRSCNVDVNGANDNVKFNNYDLSEILFYSNCTGRFRNFDFSDNHLGNDGVAHKVLDIYSFYSKIDIENITFGRIPDFYGFKMCLYGTVPGFETTHVMSNCIVDCSDNGNETYPICINSATASFHQNIFNNIDVNGIYLTESSLRMTNGAYNVFNKSNITDYISYPLIDGIDSDCSMWCGKNSFKHSLDLLTGYRYITINDADNWGHNYWGYSDCSSGTNPSSYLPLGVNCTPYYEDCPIPPFVPCTDQEEEITLFKLGQEANELRNYPAAIGYWTALLQDYPESEFCNDATSTIKAIGIMTEYGEESYSAIRSCLESAAITSDSVNVLLSIFQVCSAWCVEGRHGDRAAAIALLDSLYQKEQGDEDKEALINTALAEIDTYPTQGQNSATSLNGMLAQTIRLQEKLGVLQRVSTPKGYRRNDAQETPNLITMPSNFSIESCYPNPFNPMTVITLSVSDVTPLCLEVYNSLGQRVRVLHDGPAQIGLRKFSFDASGLGAGLYVVRAQQGSQVDVKKMLYVK